MKTVITYGTFDMFHIGHLRLLERAKQFGDRLIVAVSTDEFNAVKGKRCFMPYLYRSEIISAIRVVDLVIPETAWEQKRDDVIKYGVDTFCIGDDWRGKFDSLEESCRVVYLERTPGIDSTSIRNSTRELDPESVMKLSKADTAIRDILDNLYGG